MCDKVLGFLLVSTILLPIIIIALIWSAYDSEKIELPKSEWTCTKSETRIEGLWLAKIYQLRPVTYCLEYKKGV